MNVSEIIERECPRYVKKEMIYHGKSREVIIDTHTYPERVVVSRLFHDEDIDEVLDSMNNEYKNHLLEHFGVI